MFIIQNTSVITLKLGSVECISLPHWFDVAIKWDLPPQWRYTDGSWTHRSVFIIW